MDNDLERPLVSICCITYNHVKFIQQALDGFLMQQTSFPFEIIVHDDASTDGTTDVIKKYASQYPHLIRPIYQVENQYSKKIKISPTYVWPKARGKYIALCEGDDYWTDPHKLQKQVDFLEKHPDYVLCHHDAFIVDESNFKIKDSHLIDDFKRDFGSWELIRGPWILTLTMCYRNIIREFPPEYSKVYNADLFLTSLLGHFGKSKYLGDQIMPDAYRVHSGGVWSSIRDQWLKSIKRSISYYWMRVYYGRVGQKEYSLYWSQKLPCTDILYQLPNPQEVERKVAEGLKKMQEFLAGLSSNQDEIESIRNCLTANISLGAAVVLFRWRCPERAWDYLRQAIDLDPSAWGDRSILESVLISECIILTKAGGQTNLSILEDFVESLQHNSSRRYPWSYGLIRRVKGRYYSEAAYSCYLNDDSIGVWRNTWRALQADPRLLNDRGMLRRVIKR